MIEPSTRHATDWQQAARPMQRVGHALEVHERIGSTNDRARALLAHADADGRVVVAEEQTAGRGRRGRTWLSPPGRNLMASVALRPRIAPGEAWQLGFAAALAAADACGAVAAIGLKWPNDLVALGGERKVGGLLVETMIDGDRLSGAVIGIGINANWRREEMPPELAESATSLADLAGVPVDRVALLRRLLESIDREVSALEAGASPLARYRAACVTVGRRVLVATVDGELEGLAAGIDAGGALVVDAADGRHVLASGEIIRVRPGAGS